VAWASAKALVGVVGPVIWRGSTGRAELKVVNYGLCWACMAFPPCREMV
jgi:hypothetical protein